MTEFASKNEMEAAWIKSAACDMFTSGSQPTYDDAVEIAGIMVRGVAVYVPHLYRGGWVIRGFGYSTERIGKFISAERAGNPMLVAA